MNTQKTVIQQEEWIRLLTKGMITIPKVWRDEFGIKEGDILQAEKKEDRIELKPFKRMTPYRIYTQAELEKFLKDDQLPEDLGKKINNKFAKKD